MRTVDVARSWPMRVGDLVKKKVVPRCCCLMHASLLSCIWRENANEATLAVEVASSGKVRIYGFGMTSRDEHR
jgi:hypothetical protein